MSIDNTNRRDFFKLTSGAILTGAMIPAMVHSTVTAQDKPRSPNARLGVGGIGLRYQGSVITHKAQLYGDIVALCDVDRHVREQARAAFGSTPAIFENYRDLLKRKDVDVVLIGAPDHWHTKMVIDACARARMCTAKSR